MIDQSARAVAGVTRQCTRGLRLLIDSSGGDLAVGVPGSGAADGESFAFLIPDGAGGNHVILDATGAIEGDQITVTSEETTGGVVTAVCNKVVGTVIASTTATKPGSVVVQFDGTDWVVRKYGNAIT